MPHTPGPYSVEQTGERTFRITGRDDIRVCATDNKADAARIAYCLRIVEESEETDRKA